MADIPTAEETRALLKSVGQGKLKIDPAGPAIAKPSGLSLDFSSIAKGYAVDVVAEYLKA